jgi:hypothetical protein
MAANDPLHQRALLAVQSQHESAEVLAARLKAVEV